MRGDRRIYYALLVGSPLMAAIITLALMEANVSYWVVPFWTVRVALFVNAALAACGSAYGAFLFHASPRRRVARAIGGGLFGLVAYFAALAGTAVAFAYAAADA